MKQPVWAPAEALANSSRQRGTRWVSLAPEEQRRWLTSQGVGRRVKAWWAASSGSIPEGRAGGGQGPVESRWGGGGGPQFAGRGPVPLTARPQQEWGGGSSGNFGDYWLPWPPPTPGAWASLRWTLPLAPAPSPRQPQAGARSGRVVLRLHKEWPRILGLLGDRGRLLHLLSFFRISLLGAGLATSLLAGPRRSLFSGSFSFLLLSWRVDARSLIARHRRPVGVALQVLAALGGLGLGSGLLSAALLRGRTGNGSLDRGVVLDLPQAPPPEAPPLVGLQTSPWTPRTGRVPGAQEGRLVGPEKHLVAVGLGRLLDPGGPVGVAL